MRPQRVVVCAAQRYGDLIIPSARHHDPVMNTLIGMLDACDCLSTYTDFEQGFIDQFGTFMSREEALEVAMAANQIKQKTEPQTKLYSEDLY